NHLRPPGRFEIVEPRVQVATPDWWQVYRSCGARLVTYPFTFLPGEANTARELEPLGRCPAPFGENGPLCGGEFRDPEELGGIERRALRPDTEVRAAWIHRLRSLRDERNGEFVVHPAQPLLQG